MEKRFAFAAALAVAVAKVDRIQLVDLLAVEPELASVQTADRRSSAVDTLDRLPYVVVDPLPQKADA